MRFNSHHVLLTVLLGCIMTAPAFPASPITVVSVAPGAAGSPAIGSSQFLMENWTSTVAFTDVTISAFVYSENSADTAATAYLTTQSGAGATTATLVAQANVTLPVGHAGSTAELQLFSGLTLPPGTYYLILATTDTTTNEGWLNGDLPTPAVTATGVTFNAPAFSNGNTAVNSAYPPATTFSSTYGPGLAFDVTGEPLASGGATGLILPQIVDGGAWQTTLVITNTTTTPANAALQFFKTTDAAGDTTPWALPTVESVSLSDIQLAANATIIVHTPGTAATLTQGYGELVADTGVMAYAIFTQRVTGRPNQDGTAPAAAPGSQFLVPFDNSAPGFATSIAIVNTTESPETLTANLVLSSGQTLSGPLPTIPALGHAAFALTAQFPLSAGQQGTLELLSQGQIDAAPATGAHPQIAVTPTPTFSVIALRFNPTGAFTSLPVYVISSGLF
jgi:hypothetical protein